MNIYFISMSNSTCCDYWYMDTVVAGRNDAEAISNAEKKFFENFDINPNSTFILSCVDVNEVKSGFIQVISSDYGSK